jgi:hypothetical protein
LHHQSPGIEAEEHTTPAGGPGNSNNTNAQRIKAPDGRGWMGDNDGPPNRGPLAPYDPSHETDIPRGPEVYIRMINNMASELYQTIKNGYATDNFNENVFRACKNVLTRVACKTSGYTEPAIIEMLRNRIINISKKESLDMKQYINEKLDQHLKSEDSETIDGGMALGPGFQAMHTTTLNRICELLD